MSMAGFVWPLAISSIFLALLSFYLGAKNSGKSSMGWHVYLNGELRTLTSLSTIKGLLISVGIVIFCTGFGYLSALGFTAFAEYCSFAAPCLAGIIVGGGILEASSKAATPWINVDFVYYFISVVLIFIGYISYIGSHFDIRVVAYAFMFTAVCMLLSLCKIYLRQSNGAAGVGATNSWMGDASAAVVIGIVIGVALIVFVAIFHGPL